MKTIEQKRHIAEVNKKWRLRNREKTTKYQVEWQRKNKDKVRRYSLKRKYGLTEDKYKSLLTSQGHLCAACGTDKPGGRGGKHFLVDHCHQGGEVRGLLCCHCNLALGYAADDVNRLRLLILYLEKHERTIRKDF